MSVDIKALEAEALNDEEQKQIMNDFKCTNKKDISFFTISSWMTMACDDLNVAKLENVATFIRCYHAQQAMEKMLKAAFIVTAGKFHEISNKLKVSLGRQSIPDYIPSCAWELDDVKFPTTHNIVSLWEILRELDDKEFKPLDNQQKNFMDKITQCAVTYRYPYFLHRVGTLVCFPDIDMNEVINYADQLYDYLDGYIKRKGSA